MHVPLAACSDCRDGTMTGRLATATRRPRVLARLHLSYQARLNLAGILFVLPVLLYFAVFKFYPMSQAFWLSLTNYDLSGRAEFVGLQNYLDLLGDHLFLQALGNTVYYVVGTVVPVWIGAVVLALLFNQAVWGKDFLRLAYFVPVITAAIVVAVIWKFLFHPYGLVNAMLSVFGIGRIDWLTNSALAMPA
ncbi:MAG: sugar ABC transporter permease, partial [Chloroflexi bacterium]|nr:sugar ABC transporter permease [Chloroflexota bacterium]